MRMSTIFARTGTGIDWVVALVHHCQIDDLLDSVTVANCDESGFIIARHL
jgi:hypothetical protein